MSNLLIYMQQMFEESSHSDMETKSIDYRTWKGGYKLNDTVISLLEDLKNGGE